MPVTPVTVPNTFVASTVAASAGVNANFTALLNAFNNGTMGQSLTTSGYQYLPGGVLIQWGKITGVAADLASATTTSWPTAFPTNFWGVVCGIENDAQTNSWQLSVQTNTETLSSFKVNVSGAPATKTVTVWFIAIGN